MPRPIRTGRWARRLTALFVSLLLLAVFAATAAADSYIHGYFRYTVDDQSVTVTAYTGREKTVEVPAMIAGNPVNTIAAGSFADSTTVRTVNLPDTIMCVEAGSFASWQTVNLPPLADGADIDLTPAPTEPAKTKPSGGQNDNDTPTVPFSDAAQIGAAYTQAVAAMAQLGVIEGFPDGSFRPLETLTREQGAKIVATQILGKQAAGALKYSGLSFSDVAPDRWSAPYIAWCEEHGILHGYGDGRFGPQDTLTGPQFSKMLLCAYRDVSQIGAYTGPNWLENVQNDGARGGLFNGDPAMAYTALLQRQQASLLSHNALALE